LCFLAFRCSSRENSELPLCELLRFCPGAEKKDWIGSTKSEKSLDVKSEKPPREMVIEMKVEPTTGGRLVVYPP